MTYDERHAALVTYLRAKIEEGDWHAVADAASDLRVLEAGQQAPLRDFSRRADSRAGYCEKSPTRWHEEAPRPEGSVATRYCVWCKCQLIRLSDITGSAADRPGSLHLFERRSRATW